MRTAISLLLLTSAAFSQETSAERILRMENEMLRARLSALSEKGGGPADVTDSEAGPDVGSPATPVSVDEFVHRINVQNDQGSCVYLGKHGGAHLVVTAGHIFQDDSGRYYPANSPILIDGVQYGGWWSASSSGDVVALRLQGLPEWPAATYEVREIAAGERLTIYGRKTGLHSATATDTNWNRKGTSQLLGRELEVDSSTASGDSGGGVFDESGALVAVHSHGMSDSETICTPLSEVKTTLEPFDGKVFAAASNAQSEWLDNFTGIYLATAPWCGHCPAAKLQIPALEKLGWTVVEKNTDRERAFAAAFGIQSLPTWIVVQDGKVIARATGTGMPTQEKPRAEDVPEESELASTLPAEAGPTPYSEVARILGILKLQPDDVYADIGCGADARWCVAAAETTDCRRIIGIEIDPQRAASARAHVEALGLSGRIEIIEGDALEVDLSDVTVATVYLYSDVLEALRPKLTDLDRFASYMHQVPGLSIFKYGDAFVWNSSDQVQQPQAATTGRPYAVWDNQTYYGRVCSNPNCSMCNSIQQQLSGR